MRAVVLVSGGGAVTPFTTPDAGAREGLAAGNTMTAIRAHLLEADRPVFTAPARVGLGVVDSYPGWQGFDDVPEVLPAEYTINAAGRIEEAGVALHRFLRHLAQERDVDTIDIVAHSMGGLFSRAALASMRCDGDAPRVRALTTLGTPWTASLLGDVHVGDLTVADACGDAATEAILLRAKQYADEISQGAADEVTTRHLSGSSGWNERQRGVLDGIPVTLVAGDHFRHDGGGEHLWPHDGLVQVRSALAKDVSPAVLPHRTEAVLPAVHSIFFADQFGLPWERTITWGPDVFAVIDAALEGATGDLAPARGIP